MECFYNLFLEVSQICIRAIRIEMEKKWDLETYKRSEKS